MNERDIPVSFSERQSNIARNTATRVGRYVARILSVNETLDVSRLAVTTSPNGELTLASTMQYEENNVTVAVADQEKLRDILSELIEARG
jgi:hypothetical protein